MRLPEQDVTPLEDGWALTVQPRTDTDDWNSQVSLLTGMCAAQLMLEAKVGLLRTLPPADEDAVAALRRTATALGVPWPDDVQVGAFLAGLDANTPSTLVLMSEAPTLLRGASYATFDGELPESSLHGAIGAPYAHVTAPLRRLSDRYTTEVCLAVSAGAAIPSHIRDTLPVLPKIMSSTDSLSGKVGRACIDLTEAIVLSSRVGQEFDATVIKDATDRRDAEVFVEAETVIAPCAGEPREGERVTVRLTRADPAARKVHFTYEPARA